MDGKQNNRPSVREIICEMVNGDDMIFFDPPETFDPCIIGIADRCGMESVVVYDRDKVIENLTRDFDDGESEDPETDAEEWFAFNTIGAWVGEKTPLFITRLPT